MDLQISHAIRREHEELHGEIARAASEHGRVGTAAQLVARLMAPHLAKEETFVLPVTGLLQPIASGDIRPEMHTIIALGERLRMELPDLVAEHHMITAALESMVAAAREEGKVEFAELAMRFMTHMQMEEEVFYPAVIIAAQLLKFRLG